MTADLKMTGCFTPFLSFVKKTRKSGKDCKLKKPSIDASTPAASGKLNGLAMLGQLCLTRPETPRMNNYTVLLKHEDNNEDGVQIKRGRLAASSFNVKPALRSTRATSSSIKNAGSTVTWTSHSATSAQLGRVGSNDSATEVEDSKNSLSNSDKTNATRMQNWTAGVWKKLERSNSMASLRKRLPRLTRSKSDPLPLSYAELRKQMDLQYRQLLSTPPKELKDVEDVQAAIPGLVRTAKWAEEKNDPTLPLFVVLCAAYKKVCVTNGGSAAVDRWKKDVEAFEKDVADGGKWAPFRDQYDRYVGALNEKIVGQSHHATEAAANIITRPPQREVDTVVDIDPRVRRYLFAVNGWGVPK
ncbi:MULTISPECIES: hypothetical protein [Burkholderiaceae]|uniref:hypothetical protein n=1 Tax=Burkholderiaceae TaxID=119060 RepID=UPI0009685349|nr:MULTISPECIES: hypothetical protein [Burkholderiaceae]MCF2134704.1 hypothetical protein [Mycetohabitans sp. B3]MCG1040007.1 hypothetical protein [Mycetohabitans sp. B7]SIT72215.1 hypothetical protein SAMN04487769_2028 [Burkholderia sp. b14]